MNKIECRTIVQSLGVYPVSQEQMRDADKALALELKDGWTIAGVGVSSDVYDGRAWYTRFVTLTREALPGGGATDEQDEQSAIRRHFLALVSHCDDEADTATERAVQAIYRATRQALVHDGELLTAVPTHEMIERLEYVISECNQALNNLSLKPHIRKIYAVLMAMADGDELLEDAS